MSSNPPPAPLHVLPYPPAPADDPFEAALADEALAGFERVLPPGVLAAMRARLLDAYAAHPTGRRLVRQARPDPVRARSGDVERHRDPSSVANTVPKRVDEKGSG